LTVSGENSESGIKPISAVIRYAQEQGAKILPRGQ